MNSNVTYAFTTLTVLAGHIFQIPNMHADAHSLLQIPCNNIKGIDGLRSPTQNESRMIDNCLSDLVLNQKYSAGQTAASSFLFEH